MESLARMNKVLEKFMPLLTPLSVVCGVLLAERVADWKLLVPWVFAAITFVGSLSTNFKDFRHVIERPLPLITILTVLHVIMPTLAWGAGHLFYSGDMHTITGLVLAFIIPTGIMSFLWVSINKGSIPLTLAVIVVSTVLSPIIVPLGVKWFVGSHVEFEIWSMMSGLIWMIVIPSILGMLMNQLTKGRIKEKLGKPMSPFTKLGLMFVVMVNSAAAAPYFRDLSIKLISIIVTVFIIALIGYLLGFIAARLLRWNRELTVSLTFNSGMRNISAGVVIAMQFFPPAVSVPVIVGMLFQQILASLYTVFLRKKLPLNEDQKLKASASNIAVSTYR